MRVLAAVLAAACVAAPAAVAKFRMTMSLGHSTPRAGQAFTVRVHTAEAIPPPDSVTV
jgi:hypothetical protein